MNRKSLYPLVAILIIFGIYFAWPKSQKDIVIPGKKAGGAIVSVILPDTFSDSAKIGKSAFEAKCANCHGVDAVGKFGIAPPLIHIIYEPSHHGDEAFQRATAIGVQAHHWPFGNMPPIESITRGEVKTIITYIRELQRTNGIN